MITGDAPSKRHQIRSAVHVSRYNTDVIKPTNQYLYKQVVIRFMSDILLH